MFLLNLNQAEASHEQCCLNKFLISTEKWITWICAVFTNHCHCKPLERLSVKQHDINNKAAFCSSMLLLVRILSSMKISAEDLQLSRSADKLHWTRLKTELKTVNRAEITGFYFSKHIHRQPQAMRGNADEAPKKAAVTRTVWLYCKLCCIDWTFFLIGWFKLDDIPWHLVPLTNLLTAMSTQQKYSNICIMSWRN